MAQSNDIGKKLDEEFVLYMLEIEQRYQLAETGLNKHEKMRVEQWSKILCQVNPSPVWKRNRNLYTSLLLNQVVSFKQLRDQFVNKPPDNGNLLASLSKTEVNAKLTKKYKDVIKNFNADQIRERLLGPEELNDAEDDDDGDYCEIGDQDDSFVIQGAITDDRVIQQKGEMHQDE